MSLFAKRAVTAKHYRVFPVPGAQSVFTFLGKRRIHVAAEGTTVGQAEDFLTAPTEEMEVAFDPKVDLRAGDWLMFNGLVWEARTVRRFATGGKRSDHAQADVGAKEVPFANIDALVSAGSETIAVGSYVGDGSNDRTITTGLTGSLRYVTITTDAADQFRKTINMTSKDYWKRSQGGSASFVASTPTGIAFAGANFVVDTAVNSSGPTFFWVAFAI